MEEKRKPMELTAKNVDEVFHTCLFRENEIVGKKPICKSTLVEGIRAKFGFNTERLNGQKLNITDMVDQLANIEKGPSFLALCERKDGIIPSTRTPPSSRAQ